MLESSFFLRVCVSCFMRVIFIRFKTFTTLEQYIVCTSITIQCTHDNAMRFSRDQQGLLPNFVRFTLRVDLLCKSFAARSFWCVCITVWDWVLRNLLPHEKRARTKNKLSKGRFDESFFLIETEPYPNHWGDPLWQGTLAHILQKCLQLQTWNFLKI